MLMPRALNLDPVAQSLFEWIAKQIEERRADYDRARRYYDGDHEVSLSDRLKQFLHHQVGMEFMGNYCDVVVDALAERLTVIGFEGPSEAINEFAWDVWQRNRMDNTQIITHTETILLGDSYVLVDWDNEAGQVRLTPEKAEIIIPHYNQTTRRIDWASRKWTEEQELGRDPQTRLNIYYPERVEKYVARQGVWTPFQDEGDISWPLPWTDNSGRPLGVPIVHFRNRPLTSDFGSSEIHDIIPLQDLLNKTLVDLTMVLDTLGFAQRYTLNINHGVSRLNIVPGTVSEFHAEDPEVDAEVGQWDAANPDGLLRSIESIIQQIAGTSRTPQYLFQLMGGAPSGESLKVAESGIVHKAKRRQVGFGNSWEDVMALALRVQNAYGSPVPVADVLNLSTVWDDPQSRNEEMHLATLEAKMRIGIPKRQIWREMGYTEDQIAQMEQDIQDERVADTNIGAAILQQFQNGEI